MSLIFTPAQFSRRAEFYHQLSQLTAAGLGVVNALQQLQRAPPARSYRQPLEHLIADLGAGFTLGEACQRRSAWLPDFDIALLHVGEQSGRLDASFRSLAEYYNERARLAWQIILGLLYPAFLFHFAVFIMPFPRFFLSWDWKTYLLQTFGVLLPVYGLVAGIIYAGQGSHAEGWRSFIEALCTPVPVLGKARRYLALSRLAGALEALLSAGVTIIEAWEFAAAACGSPALRRVVLGWRPLVDAGQTPGETLSSTNRFPDLFVNQYITGEISGKLEETLQRLRTYYQTEGSIRLRGLSWGIVAIVYLGVVGMIAAYVLRFWMNYFKQFNSFGL